MDPPGRRGSGGWESVRGVGVGGRMLGRQSREVAGTHHGPAAPRVVLGRCDPRPQECGYVRAVPALSAWEMGFVEILG